MKNSIKLILIVVVLTMTTESFAQKFGIKAGLNLSNVLIKDNYDTYSDNLKMHPGFHIGATAEFPFSEMMSFETGLLLTTKGYKYNESEADYEYSEKASAYYLDIPITAKASFNVGGPKIYGLLGPYVGIGLTGKYKSEGNYYGQTFSETEDIKWGSDPDVDHLKRLDFGLLGGVGAEISSFKVELTYGLGLANISSYTEDGTTLKNRVLSLSVGYIFGGK
jgi:hypothetical protein